MSQHHIVIVGAGIVGLSTAFALLKQGMKCVTILEQATVDHIKSTSHGTSRLLRFEYGDDALYAQMVRSSLNHWKQLELLTKRTFYTRTGVLTLGNLSDKSTQASYHILKDLGLPVMQLSNREAIKRFPQFNHRDFDYITYDYEAGILHASDSLHILKSLIHELGGRLDESVRVARLLHEDRRQSISLLLQSGEIIKADRVVIATGPWVHHLLPQLNLPVRISRQYLLYFAGLPLPSFGVHSFPAFLADDLYGFPVHRSLQGKQWLKAASHSFGPTIDPDDPPIPDLSAVEQIQQRLQSLIPALRETILAHVDTCMYDVSPDEDFILDHVPDDPRVVFATGLTGHGFKFGLLLGELLSSLVRQTAPDIPLDRFRLARFAPSMASSVA